MNVIHTAIRVSDLDDARAFFVDALGLAEKRSFTRDGIENVYLGGDDEGAEIQLCHEPGTAAPVPDRTTIDHIAVAVDDVDAETERMVAETDCAVIEGPFTEDESGARIAFLDGPDGYVVELVEYLE